MVVAMAALEAKVVTLSDTVSCPGYLDFGDRRFSCWSKFGHGTMNLREGIKNSCDVYFYEVARRVGIDRIAAMANKFGLAVPLDIELPGTRSGFMPTRAWRIGQGKAWNVGDTIVSGIGQGYMQLTPLSLATMAARIATGRAIQPHLTRSIDGEMQPGARPEDWPMIGVTDRTLHAVRDGMWAVVNEQGGSAPLARLDLPNLPGVQLAGKTGSAQVRNVTREQREHGYKSENQAWELRPNALFVCFAPYDQPRYAMALVVEHGNAGAAAAAPIARDIMQAVLTRDPSAHREPPQRLADAT
jgi:penicillin-binding protein 2